MQDMIVLNFATLQLGVVVASIVLRFFVLK